MIARVTRNPAINFAAFDPGLTGAFASYNKAIVGGSAFWEVIDLPTMGAGKQVILNGAALAAHMTGIEFAIVEHVHAMPGQGVSSMFKFGTVFGQILGVLQALSIPYELVHPARWKRDMRLGGGAGKGEEARGRALELFPALNDRLSRKKDHNRAEALLLGRWWLEKNQ